MPGAIHLPGQIKSRPEGSRRGLPRRDGRPSRRPGEGHRGRQGDAGGSRLTKHQRAPAPGRGAFLTGGGRGVLGAPSLTGRRFTPYKRFDPKGQNLDARGNSLARADQIPPGGLPAGPAPPGRTPLPPSRRRPSDTPGSPSEPSAAGRLGSGGARERLRNGRQAVPKKAYSATTRRCRTRPTNPICKKGRADFSPALSCPAVQLSQEPDALLILVEL